MDSFVFQAFREGSRKSMRMKVTFPWTKHFCEVILLFNSADLVFLIFRKEQTHAPSFVLPRTRQWRPTCWTRTQQKGGRARSVSGPTSTRRRWPTSTALTSRHFSSFTALPAPPSPRQRAARQRPLLPRRCTRRWTPWTPSTAQSSPVTIQCWAHRCRSDRVRN